MCAGRSSGSVERPPGLLAGMDLDQLAPVEDPHQRPVGAHLDPGADQVARAPSRAPWPPRCDDPDAPSPSRRSARRRRSVGAGSSRGCSSTVNTSSGRHWVVPWIRSPARSGTSPRRGVARRRGRRRSRRRRTSRARTAPSAPPAACPAACAPGPDRSTNPRACAYSTNAWFNRGSSRSALVDDRRQVVGDQRREHAAEEPPRRLAAGDHRLGRLAETSTTRSMCRVKHAVKINACTHPAAGPSPDRGADPCGRSRPATRRPARRRRPAPSAPARGGGRTPPAT